MNLQEIKVKSKFGVSSIYYILDKDTGSFITRTEDVVYYSSDTFIFSKGVDYAESNPCQSDIMLFHIAKYCNALSSYKEEDLKDYFIEFLNDNYVFDKYIPVNSEGDSYKSEHYKEREFEFVGYSGIDCGVGYFMRFKKDGLYIAEPIKEDPETVENKAEEEDNSCEPTGLTKIVQYNNHYIVDLSSKEMEYVSLNYVQGLFYSTSFTREKTEQISEPTKEELALYHMAKYLQEYNRISVDSLKEKFLNSFKEKLIENYIPIGCTDKVKSEYPPRYRGNHLNIEAGFGYIVEFVNKEMLIADITYKKESKSYYGYSYSFRDGASIPAGERIQWQGRDVFNTVSEAIHSNVKVNRYIRGKYSLEKTETINIIDLAKDKVYQFDGSRLVGISSYNELEHLDYNYYLLATENEERILSEALFDEALLENKNHSLDLPLIEVKKIYISKNN